MNLNFDILSTPLNTETIDRSTLEQKSGKNIYETICILEKISKIFDQNIKNNLDNKLEKFHFLDTNSLEETIENKEQIELSKSYEALPKATSIAIQYLIQDKLIIKT
ncbi:hypothetical protein [Blattabacterium cuenoti]|uniref:hypothetical protein n=1 Tax=Blattabacterium cuenoti TaxID=1653831 RepID=UPI00163B8340|nr:hypothetical protein [Blattabacterium cuenoti]